MPNVSAGKEETNGNNCHACMHYTDIVFQLKKNLVRRPWQKLLTTAACDALAIGMPVRAMPLHRGNFVKMEELPKVDG